MAALTDNLLAYFKFDGDSVDAVAGTYNGTDVSVTYGAGKINTGLTRTSGIDSKVNVPTVALGRDFSVALWLNMSGPDQNQNLIFVQTSNNYGICADPNRVLSFLASVPNSYGSNTVLGTGWHHVVLACNHGHFRWYRDGVPDSFVYALPIVGFNPDKFFGANFDTSGRSATMDEVAIYTRALSPLGVSTLFNAGAGLAYPLSAPAGDYFEDPPFGFFDSSYYDVPRLGRNAERFVTEPAAGGSSAFNPGFN